MTVAIVISAEDNVATALEPIEAGEIVRAGSIDVTAIDAIPRGHKIALRAIRSGDRVVKYGSPIGNASREIAAGAHVHSHNLASTRGRGDLAAASREASVDGPRLAEPRE